MGLRRRPPVMLVTGAGGFVGRHLVTGSPSSTWEIVAPSSATLDIRQRDQTIATIRDSRADVVVHLAYRKDEPDTIVDGSRNVAEGASATDAHLVHLSTDIVFAGRATPYTEADEPTPVIAYGEHKLRAEQAVAAAHPGALIIRTSLVYGTDQPSPAQLDLAAEIRSPSDSGGMAFFTDEFRCPVHAGDLAHAISDLAARPDLCGPLHVTGPERVSRADLASLMARHLGADHFTVPTTTIAASGTVRPADVTLDVSKAAALEIRCRPVSEVLR